MYWIELEDSEYQSQTYETIESAEKVKDYLESQFPAMNVEIKHDNPHDTVDCVLTKEDLHTIVKALDEETDEHIEWSKRFKLKQALRGLLDYTRKGVKA
jgi:hypothetical protein